MKMENEIRAEADAFIKTVSISEGDLVQPNQELISFEIKEGRLYFDSEYKRVKWKFSKQRLTK